MSSFRVLQFNMQFGLGWDDSRPGDGMIDLEATLAEIGRHRADVILLQEVERASPAQEGRYSDKNYQRLRLGLPGYHSYFSLPRPDDRELPFGIGLAIFSRAPLVDTFREELPSPPIPFEFEGRSLTPTDRLLIGARTQLNGRDVTVLNTHLLAFFMLNASSEQHRTQRDRVAERARSISGPLLLGGDFNVSQHLSLVTQMADAGLQPVQATEVTWRRRPYVLDHIFFNPALRCLGWQVVPTPASDHHVLVADFCFADGV